MIFGAFQAILALLAKAGRSTLADKVARNEKFASEIFAMTGRPLLQCNHSAEAAAVFCQNITRSTTCFAMDLRRYRRYKTE